MNELIDLRSLHPGDLAALLTELGQPSYRAKQVFRWLSRGVSSFEEMSDLPKDLRASLAERCTLSLPEVLQKQESRDGTVKYLFGLSDGNSIESVLMRYEYGDSICLSTQAGCRMGCAFCASYDPEKSRNLSAGEILEQILSVQKDSGRTVSHVVLMGTGEPLDNYDSVLTFLRLLTHPDGLNLSMRHVSLSTCGLVPRIRELAKLKLQLTLSISLHAPTNAIRDRLMPVNKKYPLEVLIPACRAYFQETGRRISFEYAMIDGVNDSMECADQLASLLRGMPAHVNLIPLNAVERSPLRPSSRETIRRFQNRLAGRNINATVRRSLGGDISAACGQLRRQRNEGQI
ncbi:MAG: 23S rRNA (adenine(2503)-C(2))-methyltransferase RlmN [Clostridiaceae bacterium]|nr:23S rRNA (adenine(2503)-C(2))-methyltransferase RlmN [Clostridiaceae bacterium]